MAESDQPEVESRETPCLCPCGIDKDPERPQGQGDSGEDRHLIGPLGDGNTRMPSGVYIGGGKSSRGPRQDTS